MGAIPCKDDKRERILSEHNGDKAKFHRQRKQKARKRERNRELRKALAMPKAFTADAGRPAG